MKSFGVVVALYRPTEEHLGQLAAVRASCHDVVAVDNSPAPDPGLHEHLRRQGMRVIVNRNDGGLAGAYNRGARALLAAGSDVIFLLDQDSRIDESFFAEMMCACSGLDTDTFLVGPKIYEIHLARCMPVFPPGRRFPRPRRIDGEREGLFPTLFVISSGSAISAPAYRRLGAFREDYFIEYIDIEYGLRAASREVPVYVNAAVTMRQTTGRIERHGRLFTTNHEAWRRYYGARNAVHCLRLYRSRWGLHWLSGALAIHQALCVSLFERQKLAKIAAIACGYLDGRRGRLGTFERRHPRVSAFCRRDGAGEADIDGDHPAATEQGTR